MAKRPLALVRKDREETEEASSRSDDLSRQEKVKDKLDDLYNDVELGFTDQWERANDISELWEIYNCKLGHNQFYTGNSKIFVPIVHDAVGARVTRFSNQIFPKSGRYVEAQTEGGELPYALIALAEHYVRKSRLRQKISALIKNGDVEGQYTLYWRWSTKKRFITQKIENPIAIDEDTLDPDDTTSDIQEDVEIAADHPECEIIPDSDLLVLPHTADSVEDAIECGGSVTILRRWSKARIRQLMDEGEIDERVGEDILNEMSKDTKSDMPDKEKAMVEAAGVRKDGRGKFVVAFETWSLVKAKGWDEGRLCRTYFVKPRVTASCKRNPLWCDLLPVVSVPADKVQGSFKGISRIAAGVKDIQYYANDIINEAADSSAFSMMPIIMTNPEKNPRIGSMILSLAAIWQTSPQDTSFAKFPEMWRDGLEIVNQAKNQIFQSLSVNPAQITQTAQKVKRNQAEIANEQQVDILTTAEAVTVLEEGILTPSMRLVMEMDYQYRDDDITVVRYGELGREAEMQAVPPIRMDHAMSFVWYGVEQARAMQQIQQQIAAMNVLRGIPPQMYQGKLLDLSPVMSLMMEATFGPRITPRVFKDIRYQLSQDPQKENQMLLAGIEPFVHPLDQHQQHIQVHMQVLQMDPQGLARKHIMEHQQMLAAALTAQSQPMMPQGQPGAPGGAGRGVAGTPRPGAQPGNPRIVQNPAGAIHRDRMPLAMPRKM